MVPIGLGEREGTRGTLFPGDIDEFVDSPLILGTILSMTGSVSPLVSYLAMKWT